MSIGNDIEEVLGSIPPRQVPQDIEPRLEVVAEETPAPPMHGQWVRFRPQFAEAMEGSLHKIEDLERSIGQGRTIFIPGKNAAITAERIAYAAESVFHVTWAVGDMAEVLALAPGVEAMGRLLGCSSMLIEGRKGWEKTLKPMGYEFWSVTLRKDL